MYSKYTVKNLKSFCGKKTFSTALGFEARSLAVDRQSKDLGSNPSAVESVFFPQKDFKFLNLNLNLNLICIYLRYKSLKLSTRTPVGNVSYLMRN